REWRRRIFRGTDTLTAADEQAMQSLFQRWQAACDSEQVWQRFEDFAAGSRRGAPSLRGLEDYRACCRRVREILATWTAPALSKAVALQEGELSEADLARLESLAQSGEAR